MSSALLPHRLQATGHMQHFAFPKRHRPLATSRMQRESSASIALHSHSFWYAREDSNLRPSQPQCDALIR